jgi:outer membrane receptor protein involved in Fe transport
MIGARQVLLAATAMSAFAAPALAQERESTTNTAQTPVDSSAAGGIEEIVVTARKIAETLSDAPVAVSAISERRIQELGLNSIEDFAKQATGISFSQAFGRSTDRPVIRGQSNVLAGVQAGVETGAAYFVDGVYYQGDIQGFDPESIARVEIIKGPQSALYGRNTYAGAINYITKDPTDELSGSGRVTAAEYDEYQVAGSISGPIIRDVLGFRAGGRYYSYGGQYRNQLTGKKVGDEETQSAYLTLVATPTDDIKIRARGSWQKDNDGPLAIFLQGAAANNCYPGFRSPAFRARSGAVPFTPATLGTSTNNNQYFCGTIQPQPNNVRLNTDPLPITIPAFAGIPGVFGPTPAISGNFDGTAFDGVENEQWLFTNIVDWDIGGSGWVLSSLTGYRRNKNYFGTDSDHSETFAYLTPNPSVAPGTPVPNPLTTEPAFTNTNKDRQRDFSQEIRLATPTDGPFRALIGAYYFKQKFQSVDITFGSGKEGLPLGTDLSQYSTIRDRAVFGLLGWQVTDALSITGEVRYQEEDKTVIDRSTATSIFCAGEAGRRTQFGFTGTCRGKSTFKGTDPRITIDYEMPGGALIYGVFATGRKPGGFNGTAGVQAEAQLPGQQFVNYLPEKSKGGEIGVKFDALDRTLRMAVSAFYNELTNVQLTTAIPNPSGTGALNSIVTNSGDGRSQGLEIEAQAAPSEGLNLTFGFSYVDAKFTRGCDADYFILQSGGLRVNFDTRNPTPAGEALCSIKGKRFPLGSPYIVNGSASYEWGVGAGDVRLFANSSFSFEDAKYIQTDNFAKTGDAFLLNARVGVKTERYTLSLFGRNLTDEDSIPLATRWFDLRYGAGTRGLPPAAGVTFDGRPATIESGTPRGFFGTLRKGRTFGVEGTVRF